MTEAWKQWEGQTVKGVFDHYPLGQPLGGSEDHAVFQTGRGAQRDQKAAIKLVPADEAGAEQWLSRWKLAEKLSHPHLLKIFDMGRCRMGDVDMAFVVMEFADEDLSQILPERALAPEEVVEMLRPLLDALGYLHRQGLVHCRIKPANIMAMGNQVKLSSDGLSRAGSHGYTGDRPSAYDPPEKAGDVMTATADAWSLGMTLIEVITQRLPVWDAAGGADPVVPATLPEPWPKIVGQCLRRDPRARCSVAEIAAQLQFPGTPPRIQQAAGPRRRPVVVPMAAAALVVAAIAGGWQWMQSRSGDHATVTAGVPEKETETPAATPKESPRTQSPNRPVHDQPSSPVVARPSPAHVMATSSPAAPPVAVQTRMVEADKQNGVVREVIPEVPQKALNTIHGTIEVNVRVQVDTAGNVTSEDLDLSGPSQYFDKLTPEAAQDKYFAKLALQAARSWKFAPDEEGGVRSGQIQFRFTNREASASAKRMLR